MWNKFDTLPEENRPIIVAVTYKADAGFASAHLFFAFGTEAHIGFNGTFVINKTDDERKSVERLPSYTHAVLRDCGKWAYVSDILAASGVADIAESPNVFVDGEVGTNATLRGEHFEP